MSAEVNFSLKSDGFPSRKCNTEYMCKPRKSEMVCWILMLGYLKIESWFSTLILEFVLE